MAHRIVFHPAARAELEKIYDDVADKANPNTAFEFVSGIGTYCQGLTDFPMRGTERRDIVPGLRVVGYRRRIAIAFTVKDDAVMILGIFAKGRDVTGLMIEERASSFPIG